MSDELTHDNASVKPIDILLVEDSEADVKITLRAFKKARLQNNIYVVSDGQEALEFIYHQGQYQDKDKSPRPGLILLDINMPRVSGFEFLEKIKKDDEFKQIPIIMLTSSISDQDVLMSYGSGASSYIQKPVNYEEFVKVVEGFNFYWHIVNKLPERKGK